MAVDWLRIKNDYINGGGSYRDLAKKYNVNASTLMQKAAKEKWSEDKRKQLSITEAKSKQKSAEKTADALSEEAATKVRIRGKLLKMVESWVVNQEDTIHDVADFRRIVQSCVDLGVMEVQESEENDGDGLLEALAANAESLFDDGDDSSMLPDEGD